VKEMQGSSEKPEKNISVPARWGGMRKPNWQQTRDAGDVERRDDMGEISTGIIPLFDGRVNLAETNLRKHQADDGRCEEESVVSVTVEDGGEQGGKGWNSRLGKSQRH